jgi:hypothetical protein
MSDFWGPEDEDAEIDLEEDSESELPAGTEEESESEEIEHESSPDEEEEEFPDIEIPSFRRADAPLPPLTPTDLQPEERVPTDVVQVLHGKKSTFGGILLGTSMVALSVAVDAFNLIAPAGAVIQSLPDEH